MPAPTVQILAVPDVPVAPALYAASAAWIAATLVNITRLGLAVSTNQADLVILLGSATGDATTDPITPDNPNQLGTFYGGAGQESPDVQGITAMAFYAFLRYPPPAGTQDPPPIAPTTGATFEMEGS